MTKIIHLLVNALVQDFTKNYTNYIYCAILGMQHVL